MSSSSLHGLAVHPKSIVTDTTERDWARWLSISAVLIIEINAKHGFVLDGCAKTELKKEKQLTT